VADAANDAGMIGAIAVDRIAGTTGSVTRRTRAPDSAMDGRAYAEPGVARTARRVSSSITATLCAAPGSARKPRPWASRGGICGATRMRVSARVVAGHVCSPIGQMKCLARSVSESFLYLGNRALTVVGKCGPLRGHLYFRSARVRPRQD
jgi:hypothetical protein